MDNDIVSNYSEGYEDATKKHEQFISELKEDIRYYWNDESLSLTPLKFDEIIETLNQKIFTGDKI